jgi:threonine dehydrogenase-like Zn-dependent dehydrogenase
MGFHTHLPRGQTGSNKRNQSAGYHAGYYVGDVNVKDIFSLDGKVTVVVGGAGGIGQAIATGLAFYGAQVVIASRKQESLERAVSEIKGSVQKKGVLVYR